jgi:hypothetical protein
MRRRLSFTGTMTLNWRDQTLCFFLKLVFCGALLYCAVVFSIRNICRPGIWIYVHLCLDFVIAYFVVFVFDHDAPFLYVALQVAFRAFGTCALSALRCPGISQHGTVRQMSKMIHLRRILSISRPFVSLLQRESSGQFFRNAVRMWAARSGRGQSRVAPSIDLGTSPLLSIDDCTLTVSHLTYSLR